MKILKVAYEMRLAFAAPVTDHYFQFRCLPMDGDGQTVEALEVAVEPAGTLYERVDGFGNRICYGEALTPHDSLRVRMRAKVRVAREAGGETRAPREGDGRAGMQAELEPDMRAGTQVELEPDMRARMQAALEPDGQVPCVVYRYPSALTMPDAAMRAFQEGARMKHTRTRTQTQTHTQTQAPGFPEFLMHELYRRFSYERGCTHVSTTAAEAFALGKGVCQDYAHIYVVLCRLAGFPARYVTGMAVGEGATHAWAEVWQNGKWTAYDPTHDCPADDRYIKLSHGRDFADCSVDRGCFFGGAGQEQTVYVKVEEEWEPGASA